MGTSPNRSYPYPAGSDAVDVPGDMEALADAVDTDMAAVIAGTGLADGAVTTAKIADGSVTDAKLAVPKVDQSVVGNLLPGGFADATDLTLATGQSAGITADTTNYLVGSSSFLVTSTGNNISQLFPPGWSYTVAYDNEPITFSAWVRAQFAGSVSAFWRVLQNGGIQTVLGSTTATVQNTWVLVQATTTQFSEGDVLTNPYFRVNTTTTGDAFSVDKLGIWLGAGGLWAPPGTPIANLGTYTDESVGRRIFTWDAVNARWQMTYGDTGWRVLTGAELGPNISAGSVYVRRQNDVVNVIADGIGTSASWVAGNQLVPLASGFLGPLTYLNDGYYGTTKQRQTLGGGGINLFDVPASSSNLRYRWTWLVNAAWPTSLPGTASGSIPS